MAAPARSPGGTGGPGGTIAASALPPPPEALEEIVKAPIPDAAYRMIGDLGWRWQVHRHGLPQSELHARPLDHEAPDAPERPASPGPGSG